MMQTNRRWLLAGAGALALALAATPASAQKKYDDGATDTEIKVGHTNPYSGNASAYGVIGKTIEAFFKKVHDDGGINGRKINFITYDDGYAPPKTVEMVRKLVEEDKVLIALQHAGHAAETRNPQVHEPKKVPHLFVATGASKWGSPKEISLDHGVAARLCDGGCHLRQAHPRHRQGSQDRRPDAERRLRQGLFQRLQGRSRQGQ
jgi:branched-chain amino acid transport system substrate-binding protein